MRDSEKIAAKKCKRKLEVNRKERKEKPIRKTIKTNKYIKRLGLGDAIFFTSNTFVMRLT